MTIERGESDLLELRYKYVTAQDHIEQEINVLAFELEIRME